MKKIGLTRAEFRTFKPARRIPGRFFTLLAGRSSSGSARCACVVSKKAAVRAVSRNTIKRRCREALRARMPGVAEPLVLVFHAKSAAASASFADIQRDIEGLLRKVVG